MKKSPRLNNRRNVDHLDIKMRKTIVYIVGRGHSGSTMLELLLNRNPSIAAMGEVNLLPLQLYRTGDKSRWIGECSCNSRPLECPTWGPTLRKVQHRTKLDLETRPLSLRVSDEGLAEEFGWKKPWSVLTFKARRFFRKQSQNGSFLSSVFDNKLFKPWAKTRDIIYESYSESCGVNILVDASKDYLQMVDLYRFSKHKVKVLYITRDVRGHAWSSIRKKGETAANEAATWKRLNENILHSLKHIEKPDWLHVKYEDLCSSTNQTLSRIFDFVGAPDEQLDPDKEKQKRHTIAGNRTRFRDLDVIRHDEKWKENLSETDLQTLQNSTQATAKLLGYKF